MDKRIELLLFRQGIRELSMNLKNTLISILPASGQGLNRASTVDQGVAAYKAGDTATALGLSAAGGAR